VSADGVDLLVTPDLLPLREDAKGASQEAAATTTGPAISTHRSGKELPGSERFTVLKSASSRFVTSHSWAPGSKREIVCRWRSMRLGAADCRTA
jgi:hypothetical protein